VLARAGQVRIAQDAGDDAIDVRVDVGRVALVEAWAARAHGGGQVGSGRGRMDAGHVPQDDLVDAAGLGVGGSLQDPLGAVRVLAPEGAVSRGEGAAERRVRGVQQAAGLPGRPLDGNPDLLQAGGLEGRCP